MSKVHQGLGNLRASAAAFWSARTEQERRFLAVGGIVLGLAFVYAVFIDPALSGRDRLRKELPPLRQQAAEMQALAAQAAQLAAQPPAQPQPLSRETVTAALTARGLTAQNIAVTGDYVKAEFKGVQFAGLVTWLDAVRRENRLVVQDAKISAQQGKDSKDEKAGKEPASAGIVDAALTLRVEAGGR